MWDIEKEYIYLTFGHKRINATITSIIEIPYLKLLAVASQDKLITFWNVAT